MHHLPEKIKIELRIQFNAIQMMSFSQPCIKLNANNRLNLNHVPLY